MVTQTQVPNWAGLLRLLFSSSLCHMRGSICKYGPASESLPLTFPEPGAGTQFTSPTEEDGRWLHPWGQPWEEAPAEAKHRSPRDTLPDPRGHSC